MEKEYVISNIINHIIAITEQKTKSKGLCFLLGAGADITSGGKTFRTLKIDFLKSNGYDVSSDIEDQKLTEYFDSCVEKFSEVGRCIELESIMRKHSTPSEGYELIVLLAELGYIDAIVTTNFDLLLEETQKILGIRPYDIFAPGVAVPKDFYEKRQKHTPIYMKLHGDLYGRYVSHLTKGEIVGKEYGSEYVHMLTYILQNYSVISVGYGGYDELIVDIFRNNVHDLNTVFWCDVKEPNASAPLVKLLEEHNNLKYVKCSFDTLLCELAGNLLKNKVLPDTNPHFMPSIISAKIKEQNRIYAHQEVIKKEILRDNLIMEFEYFLTCIEENLIFVHGKRGMGKTTLMRQVIEYYNELSFIPIIVNTTESKSILEHFAYALGYKTDVPFALLYNFAKWHSQNNTPIIFIVDEIEILKNQDSSIKYIKELCDYLSIVKEYVAIKVIICVETVDYKFLNMELQNTIYHQQICKSVEVTKFASEELQGFLTQNTDSEFWELMCEPYIWGMVTDDVSELEFSLERCIERFILSNVEANNYHYLNKSNLSLYMEKIARVSLNDADSTEVNVTVIDYLRELGIVDSTGTFIYDIFSEYYYYKFLKRQGCKKYIDIINKNDLDFKDNVRRSGYARILSDVNNADDIRMTLEFLADLLERDNTKHIILLIYETLQRIQKYKFTCLENYLLGVNLRESKIKNLLDFVCNTSRFATKDPFKILNIAIKYKINSFDAYVIKHEYLKEHLYRSIKDNNFAQYLNLLNIRISCQDAGSNLCDLLYILTEWGPDNLTSRNYNILIQEFQHLFDKNYDLLVTEEAYKIVAEKVKKYSYNVLFNSGPDVEEKYNQATHDLELIILSQKVIHGETLNETDYLQLLHKANDIDNAWTFLICNFITIISMINDFESTYKMLEIVPRKFEGENVVKQIDFYLSSVFMSLYISHNNVFDNFNIVFSNIVDLYERNLFELPQTRMATLHRFSDEFELIFEDGFNPLAFYFYVSPSECYLQKKSWNNGKNYLHLYWSLSDKLEQSGNYKGILRIVHALGQMISIYPQEGFNALENVPIHSHEIVKKGVLRILKENYLRYPKETKRFLKNTKLYISSEDMLEIKSNINSYWANRTFEQLHWSRIIVNLSAIKKKDVANIFLKNVFSSQSYKKFMFDFFKDIL